jgi:hypothetical protein
VVSGQLSVVSGQWSVVSGQLSVVSGQLSVVSGQFPAAQPGKESAMNPSVNNPIANGSGSEDFEETLRLLARVSAPEGLEKRVEAGLRAAPRTARILRWPVARNLESAWARSAAAAAIFALVIGGGWGLYSRVQPVQPARAIAVPHAPGGGFSNAGAMRTPQTLNGPIVAPSATAQPAATPAVEPTSKPATQPKATSSAKTGALPSQKQHQRVKLASANKATAGLATLPADAQPAVIPAK